jgi:hypothetical protein
MLQLVQRHIEPFDDLFYSFALVSCSLLIGATTRLLIYFAFVCSVCFSKAFAIPHETLMACDCKQSCKKRILNTPVHSIQHYFQDLDYAVIRKGPCILHPSEGFCQVTRKSSDCLIGGMSCHPFSSGRGNIKETPPHMHPDYKLVNDDYFALLDNGHHKGGICEEVMGWDKICPDNQIRRERCNVPGVRTYKDVWCHKLTQRGYAYACIELNNNVWFDSPKKRLTHAFFVSLHIFLYSAGFSYCISLNFMFTFFVHFSQSSPVVSGSTSFIATRAWVGGRR